MASVFEINKNDIDENTSSETLDNWDSMMHMNLIVALEEEFDIEIDEEEIIEMMDFPAIVAVIEKHKS